MLEKLRSERGESIGEALAAMLIVALAALMLAGMTTAATRIVEKSPNVQRKHPKRKQKP